MTEHETAPRFCDEPTGYYLRELGNQIRAVGTPAPSDNPMFGVFDEMRAITLRKNSDYANSTDPFRNFRVCEQMGIPAYEGVVIRMSDKFSRILNLIEKGKRGEGPAVADESLRDTLLDLANYAAICVCLLDEAKGR